MGTAHATPEAAEFYTRYFTAKSAHDVEGTMALYSEDGPSYYDATLGWAFTDFEAIHAGFAEFMPTWPEKALSYSPLVLGDLGSAVVFVTDTPELFGNEIRALAAVNLRGGKIVRWVDYWDARHFGLDAARQMRTAEEQFPRAFGEDHLDSGAATPVRQVAAELNDAFRSGDASAATQLFGADAHLVDLTLRTHLEGRLTIGRYLERALDALPYGRGTLVRHTLGGVSGGGYEWIGQAVPRGIAGLEVDDAGKITRAMYMWDGALVDEGRLRELSALAFDRSLDP